MQRFILSLATVAAVVLTTATAEAQWVTGYYAPAYAPVAYPPVVQAYYAPPAYYAPVRTAAYYAPVAPAYYAPAAPAYYAAPVAPVVVGRPVVPFYSGYGGAEIRVPGHPVRNTFRTIIP